ncbi:MAG: 4Fe-4S ferredoxin iron-sulfur binding domain protein [Deltaproteobacteria bacterium]|nr:4Fe-4S ferredoxin iron-sulfur binding domain protein [Deltaproteobacteria bacterium]
MSHHRVKSGYAELVGRLNRFPQGAPPSELLNKILRILFQEHEAHLVAALPIKPFTARTASTIWAMDLPSTRALLEGLAARALLVDIDRDGESVYALPPPMAGFFEFSLMRVRHDIDQQALSELFYQYLNVEEDFIRDLFARGDTHLGRTFVHEPVLSNDNAVHVLDYERASEVIRSAMHRAVGMCYCRHKMQHMGRACGAPMNICMTFNACAASLSKHGHARTIDTAEGLDLLQQAYEHNLVQFGENGRQGVNFICNCCGCCCEAMIAQRRFANLHPVHTTNFLPEITDDDCNGCGKCVEACPVEAMTLVSANDSRHPKKRLAKLDADVCLGCGLCVRACKPRSVTLTPRAQRVITPLNGAHRVVMMAIERGTFQHLLFDNRVLWSHRALAAVLGVVLRLPPVKQLMATQQVKSRYMEALIARRHE